MSELLERLERLYGLHLTNIFGEPNDVGQAILDGDAIVVNGRVELCE